MSIGQRVSFVNPYGVVVFGKILDIVGEDNWEKYPFYSDNTFILRLENWMPNCQCTVNGNRCQLA